MVGLILLITISGCVPLVSSCAGPCAPEVFLPDEDLSYGRRIAGLLRNHAVKVGWEKVATDALRKTFGANLTPKQKIAVYCSLGTGSDKNISSAFLSEIGSSYMLLKNDLCATRTWQEGTSLGIWPSILQRPLLRCCKDLRNVPWHDEELSSLRDSLEANCHQIKDEVAKNSASIGRDMIVEGENVRSFSGSWKTLVLYDAVHGGLQAISAEFPETMKSIQPFIANVTLAKFSKLTPGSRIYPHTGPTNCALRTHFTVYHSGGARIRVGREWREWQTCKAFTFDSAFEHEVIHDGNDERIVLIVDNWRDQTPESERDLSIFA